MAVVVVMSPLWVLPILRLTDEMSQRERAWREGPAPLAGISDIKTQWVSNCWVGLGNYRDLPVRD